MIAMTYAPTVLIQEQILAWAACNVMQMPGLLDAGWVITRETFIFELGNWMNAADGRG